jgi:hypothetical protein
MGIRVIAMPESVLEKSLRRMQGTFYRIEPNGAGACLLLPSVFLPATSSSGGGETKPKSTKDKGTELHNSVTIVNQPRTPNQKKAPIVRKSVSAQAHFKSEVLLRNNCPHLGQGNPPDCQIGICLGEIIPQHAGHSLS